MSNVIRFLEDAGARASDVHVSVAGYAAAVARAEVSDRERQALMDRDVPALQALLDGRPLMFCMIVAPDGADEQNTPEQPDNGSEPEQEPEEK